MTRSEREIDRLVTVTAAEYADEEQAAAAEEAGEATTSSVFSVRLPAEVHAAVRAAAYRAHLTPSALIRQWGDRTGHPARRQRPGRRGRRAAP